MFDIAQMFYLQQALHRIVVHIHLSVARIHQHADAHMLYHREQVIEVLLFFGFGLFKGIDHLVKLAVQFIETLSQSIVHKRPHKIGIADGSKKTGQFPVGLLGVPDEKNHLGHKQHAEDYRADTVGRFPVKGKYQQQREYN